MFYWVKKYNTLEMKINVPCKNVVRSFRAQQYNKTLEPKPGHEWHVCNRDNFAIQKLHCDGQNWNKLIRNVWHCVHAVCDRHASEKEELIKELNSMKEFLHTYEQTMERKDRIISNLTKAVYRQRDKLELMRNFCTWRLQHNDSKREVSCWCYL